MNLERFGLNVAKARIKRNISAYELSLRLGKDKSYISKLENGKVNVTLNVIIAISEELNVPITSLFE